MKGFHRRCLGIGAVGLFAFVAGCSSDDGTVNEPGKTNDNGGAGVVQPPSGNGGGGANGGGTSAGEKTPGEPAAPNSTPPQNTPPTNSEPEFDDQGIKLIRIDGFRYATKRTDWNENFKSNGSMRHDFENTPDGNQCVVGYFVVDGPNDEEISAKLGGGTHSDDHPTWADTYDIGLARFDGSRARLRFEATHPDYNDGPTQNISGLGDLRNKWVGAMGLKLNVDQDHDGQIDHIRVLGYIDPQGLDEAGKPKNGWVKTFDVTLALNEVKLKSPTIPYVATIGHPEGAQATLRIDGQNKSKYKYKYITYRTLEAL